MRSIFSQAVADFRQRSRQYNFFIIMVLMLYLAYLVYTSDMIILVGQYQGIMNGAYAGSLMALTLNVGLGLAGFYLAKNSIKRDLQTGLGQIIAAAPVRKIEYLFGKWLSHVFLFCALMLVFIITTCILLIFTENAGLIDVWSVLCIFMLLSLPIISLTAGVAILFEVTPILRAGIGNLIYFFLFLFVLEKSTNFSSRSIISDPFGLQFIAESMMKAAKEAFPEFSGGFGFLVERCEILGRFVFSGIEIGKEVVFNQVLWAIFGLVLVVISSLIFNRFTQKGCIKKRSRKEKLGEDKEVQDSKIELISLSRLEARKRSFPFLPILFGEMRMNAREYPTIIYLLILGLNIAIIFTQFETAISILYPILMLLPVLLWSKLGCREMESRVNCLIASAPNQWMKWAASIWGGILMTALFNSGFLMAILKTGQNDLIFMWLSTVIFVPVLASAMGYLSGSSRLFEFVYVLIWYLGPLQKMGALDFLGNSSIAAYYLGISVLLLLVSYFAYFYQMRKL